MKGLLALRYPAYFATILGLWKVLAAIAVPWPRLPRLKERACAGIAFDLTGAAFSHLAAGHGLGEAVKPLIILGLAVASWALRPPYRVLGELRAGRWEIGAAMSRGEALPRLEGMQARMKNPVMVLSDAMGPMATLASVVEKTGLPAVTVAMIELRASQINGCGLCVDMHSRHLKKLGESDERVFAVAAWRDTPFYGEAERAALALAEAVTRIADKEDAVPDAIWNEAKRHYDEAQLSALLLAIAKINVWNRLNVATRQLAGSAKKWEK